MTETACPDNFTTSVTYTCITLSNPRDFTHIFNSRLMSNKKKSGEFDITLKSAANSEFVLIIFWVPLITTFLRSWIFS